MSFDNSATDKSETAASSVRPDIFRLKYVVYKNEHQMN